MIQGIHYHCPRCEDEGSVPADSEHAYIMNNKLFLRCNQCKSMITDELEDSDMLYRLERELA